MRTMARIWIVALAVLPAGVFAETVNDIFDQMLEKETACLEDVDSLLVGTQTMGTAVLQYYEKVPVKGENGETINVLRNVPPQEIQQRQSGGSNALGDADPAQLRDAAALLEQAGEKAELDMRAEMGNAGLPAGLEGLVTSASEEEPWLPTDPQNVTAMYAMMLRGAAQGKEEQAARDDVGAQAHQQAADKALIASKSRLVGRETVDGIEAKHVTAENLDQRQTLEDGKEFTLNSMNLWVDAQNDVPLKLQMDGEMSDGKEVRPIRIEREDKDYRHVEGCGCLYRPFLSVMKISGIMDEKQKAQMQEAQAKMADFDKQLAQMPAAQRDMILRQMGPQMEMMKKMASGGGIEIESKVVELRCNTGMPSPLQMAQATMSGGMLGMGMGAGTGAADEVKPYYVDEKGIGVIRYADSGSAKGPFFLTVKNTATGKAVVDALGPYSGPKVGVYIGSLKMLGIPYTDIELELYQDGPHRTAVRFRPEIDPAKAESQSDCGKMSSTGECSQ
jgi:hypothetical protein